jgi:hypothetical protein
MRLSLAGGPAALSVVAVSLLLRVELHEAEFFIGIVRLLAARLSTAVERSRTNASSSIRVNTEGSPVPVLGAYSAS